MTTANHRPNVDELLKEVAGYERQAAEKLQLAMKIAQAEGTPLKIAYPLKRRTVVPDRGTGDCECGRQPGCVNLTAALEICQPYDGWIWLVDEFQLEFFAKTPLAVPPTELKLFTAHGLAGFDCPPGVTCIHDFLATGEVPPGEVSRSNGFHYGPLPMRNMLTPGFNRLFLQMRIPIFNPPDDIWVVGTTTTYVPYPLDLGLRPFGR